MDKYKMRVKADRYNQYKDKYGDDVNCIPVDMNGRCIFPDKNDPNNLKNAAEDIKEFYGLDDDYGLEGGE